MPRKKREKSGTGIYHVMMRGINHQDIFEDRGDYWKFLKLLRMQSIRRTILANHCLPIASSMLTV